MNTSEYRELKGKYDYSGDGNIQALGRWLIVQACSEEDPDGQAAFASVIAKLSPKIGFTYILFTIREAVRVAKRAEEWPVNFIAAMAACEELGYAP